jgi:PAS domain S-box-containing protein
MITTTDELRKYHFLEGGGEMGELTRNFDWSSTPVGPVQEWPQALKASVGILLHSGFPMFLWWGEDMIQFYNDAYRPSLGNEGKHPKALGQKAVDCWPEIWDIIFPLITQVKTENRSFFFEDQLVPIFRNGKIEDVYWTFSYSSVIGETGNIDGVLVVCNETTKKVNSLKDIERAQLKLALSEANLRNVILQSPVAMCILKGPRYTIELANDRMFELWGKPRREFVGKPIFDVLLDAKKEGFGSLLDQVYKSGKTFTANSMPVTLPRHGTTETVYVNFVYEAFREGDGTISGVVVVAVDVTEEVVSRKRLEESENKVRTLVASAPFPIGVYEGREMRITMVNQAIIDVWGKGPNVIGKTYYEVLPELEEQQIYPKLDSVFTTGIPYGARNQRVDLIKGGKLQPFYFNYSFTPLFDSSGKVYGVMNTAADVTDLTEAKLQVERSERNFRNMVKQAPVAMCIMIGPDHVVEVANDLFMQLWGKREEEIMNRPVFEGISEAKEQGLEKLLAKVYAEGEPFIANEHPVVLLRNGKYETIYQNFVYEPYRDADGTILGVLAISIEVTEQVNARHKIEDVVKERTESLRKSNSELSQFAYIASHDLQEPARKISTFVEMLTKSLGGQVEGRSKTYLQKIDLSARRMLNLIRDVLAFSQLSASSDQFSRVDLNVVLEETKNDFELLIEEKGSIIENDLLPVVEAIPVQMSQLFTNLISNALKFTQPDTKGLVKIRSEVIERKSVNDHGDLMPTINSCRIDFIDNGIGFHQENADQIFDIFQRLHAKSEYQGTGIGLAMCKKIAENHGGQIFARSKPGEGATFTVVLPVSQS